MFPSVPRGIAKEKARWRSGVEEEIWGDEGEEMRRELGAKAAGLCLHTFRSLSAILIKTRLLHESYFYSMGSLPVAEAAFVNFWFHF